MKHTDIAIGDVVYLKAKKQDNSFDSALSEFKIGYGELKFVGNNELEGAITEKELNELREKANNSFVPVVGEKYEFSDDKSRWRTSIFRGFSMDEGDGFANYFYIRPIQKKCTIEIPEEFKEAVENFISSLK